MLLEADHPPKHITEERVKFHVTMYSYFALHRIPPYILPIFKQAKSQA